MESKSNLSQAHDSHFFWNVGNANDESDLYKRLFVEKIDALPEVQGGKFSIVIRIDNHLGRNFYVKFNYHITLKLDLHCLEGLLNVVQGSNFILIAVKNGFYQNKTSEFWKDFDGDCVEFEHDTNRLVINNWDRFTEYELKQMKSPPKKYCTHVTPHFLLQLFQKMTIRMQQIKAKYPNKSEAFWNKTLDDELRHNGIPFHGKGIELAIYFLFCSLHAKNRLIVYALSAPLIISNKMIGYKCYGALQQMIELNSALESVAEDIEKKMQKMTRTQGFQIQVVGEISDAIDEILPQLYSYLSNDERYYGNEILLRILAALYHNTAYISATCKAYNRFIIHDASMVAFKKRGPILSTLTRKICEPLVQGKQYVNLNLTTLPTFAHNIGQKYVAGMQQSNNQCHESLGAISKGDAGFTDKKEITPETANGKNYIKTMANRRLIRQYGRQDTNSSVPLHPILQEQPWNIANETYRHKKYRSRENLYKKAAEHYHVKMSNVMVKYDVPHTHLCDDLPMFYSREDYKCIKGL
eukprot:384250_1